MSERGITETELAFEIANYITDDDQGICLDTQSQVDVLSGIGLDEAAAVLEAAVLEALL